MTARARRELDKLYRGHRDAVYRFLLRDLRDPHEAEDVTQTAFLQAYGSVLRGRRPERPRAWLLTIADNLRRRRFVRAQGRPREVPLHEVEIAAPETPSASELGAALGELPPQQRAALVLREIAGLSYEEIAHRLGVTVGSVQMLLFRARASLRVGLEGAARRTSSLLPGWLLNALGHGERLVLPARAAGVAVALGVAALVTSGAPAAPETRSVTPAQRVAVLPARGEPARVDASEPSVVVRGRARSVARGTPAPPAAAVPPAEIARAEVLPRPAAPELPNVPSVPAPPLPELPLPELPLPVELEPPAVPPLPALP